MDKSVIQQKLGLRLKGIRLDKGLKQENLEEYGFSHRHYGKLERGLVNPTLETLVRLSEIFEVDLSDLFAFMGENEEVSENAEAVAIKIRQLLKENDEEKIRKLKIFLEEIL